MKKQLISRITYALMIVLLALAVLPARSAFAAATTTVKAGNWSDATVWSLGHVPLSTEDVTTAHDVTMDSTSAVCLSLTLHGQTALTFTASGVLTVGGNVFIGTGNNANSGTLDMSSGGTLKLTGAMTQSGNKSSHDFSAGTIEYNGSAQTVYATTYTNLTLSGSGSKTLSSGSGIITNILSIPGPAKAKLSGNITNLPQLKLGGTLQPSGTWGPFTSSATNQTDYYFDSTGTGMITVSTGTTPVTMNYFYAKGQGSSLTIDWSTGTETGNVGFNLYVEDALGRHKLNDQLIPATGITTHVQQNYHFTAEDLVLNRQIKFYIEDLDFLGRTVLHGPFNLGIVYGQRVISTTTDCSQMQVRGKICFLAPR